MLADKDDRDHAHKSPDGPLSSKWRSSNSHPPIPTLIPTPTLRHRPSNIAHDTATSNDGESSQTAAGYSSHSSGSSLSTARPQSDRDSFYSILEDPFFQDYAPNPPTSGSDSHDEGVPVKSALEGDDKSPKRWPPPRRESLIPGSLHFWVCHCWPAPLTKSSRGRDRASVDM